MSSPEDKNPSNQASSDLSQRAQSLSSKEAEHEALQNRLKAHQQQVADKERANRIKAQDLIQREQKLADEKHVIEQERRMLLESQESMRRSRQRRSTFMLPILLIAAIAAGVLAYQNIEQQKKYFNQVANASKNIDALAQILSVTQDEVVIATSQLSNKKIELERTKTMLDDLKSTTEQLQYEIRQLKGDSSTSAEEKQALTLSADNLSEQFTVLKAQLEENYLTNDINEVYIEYQENDLKQAHLEMAKQKERLDRQANEINVLKLELAKLHKAP